MKEPRFEAKALGATTLRALLCFFLAAILSAPAWADVPSAHSAQPGTLNYVEGQASIGSRTLDSKSVGVAELKTGQTLTTDAGKAEVLLTPGVFLRIGSNSSVRMISPSLTETEVAVDHGHAMLEVAEIHPENDILVNEDGGTTRLLKTGLYDFDQNHGVLRVFDGKAAVTDNAGHATVKGGREVSFTASPLKARKFDKKAYFEDDLYRWSSLRSAYEAEANVDAAGAYYAEGYGPWGPGWWGADWYWDPWFDGFAFIPGDGIFFSPFGWGFYSPWFVDESPLFYGFGFGHGYPYHPYMHHFSDNYRNWGGPGSHYVASRSYTHGIYRGPGSIGGHGFHSGPRMVSGLRGFGHGMGGFHGEGESHGGGFHGGGGFRGGGGFHGGGGFGGGGGGFHGGGGGGFHGR